jgi:ABC-type transporter Mla subunit MlaD
LLAAAFDAHATSKISDLVRKLAALPRTAFTGHPASGRVARLLSALSSTKQPKAAVLTDISAIERLLADGAAMEFGAFVQMVAGASATTGRTRGNAAGVRDDLVAQYKQKLEAALGDDKKFAAIYDSLRANLAMGKPEIATLAREMTGSGGRTYVEEDLEPPPVPGSVQGERHRRRNS